MSAFGFRKLMPWKSFILTLRMASNGSGWQAMALWRGAALPFDGFPNDTAVECRRRDRDRYDRTVATCGAREIDDGRWLVLNG